MKNIAGLLFILSVISINPAYSQGSDFNYSNRITEAIDSAGANGVELRGVLSHYAELNDTLKLKAAEFLIANMKGHCYVTYSLQDTSKNDIDFLITEYPDYDSALSALDSMEEKYGTLEFNRDVRYDDIAEIDAGFLIDQIDYAFKAWREKPWARGYSFDQFCNYILPYRGSNEPLDSWRSYFYDEYANIADEMKDTLSQVEAASLINNDIMSWFKFDRLYYLHPSDQGLTEMLYFEKGRCEDMTNLAIYAMRANGLAVTSDYTPYWANAGNNHAWNALVLPDGKVLPFMGAEANPGRYGLRYRLAKAYRKMYAEQDEDLIFQENRQEKVPAWLGGRNYLDVTASYVPVSDVPVEFEEIPDSIDIAYLCVFNSGEWCPIMWGRIIEGGADFVDMGRNIVYLPSLYLNRESEPRGAPFMLDSTGEMTFLEPDSTVPIEIKLNSTTKVYCDISTDGVKPADLVDGKSYELFVWEDGWSSAGKCTAESSEVTFAEVPSGALYWLKAEDSDGDERIFTYENNAPRWW